MDINLIVGTIGGLMILAPFLLNQFDVWSNDDWKYDFVNAIGSVFLVIYAVLLESPVFFVLNAIWAIVSIKDVIIYFIAKKR